MKKTISLLLAIVMIASVCFTTNLIPVSANEPTKQTVWNISNETAFGGSYCSTTPGYVSENSVCINGNATAFGKQQKFENIQNGYYLFSAYVLNNGFSSNGIKLLIKPGDGSTPERVFEIDENISSTEWTRVYVIAEVKSNICNIGFWCRANQEGNSLLIDDIKLEKLDGALDIGNFGADVSETGGFLGDKCLQYKKEEKATFTGLDPFTTYTFYYAVQGSISGNEFVKIRTFNGTNDDKTYAVSDMKIDSNYVGPSGAWRVYSAKVTTGLVGMITIHIWRASALSNYKFSSVVFKKESDNKHNFVPNSVIASDRAKDKVTVDDGCGYVTDSAINVPAGTTQVDFGKRFYKLDNGIYLLTAYAKSENATFTFKGYDGDTTTSSLYSCPLTVDGNEWKQIKIEVEVTNGMLLVAFWFGSIENDLYLDGFQINKMNCINIVNPDDRWPRTPQRIKTYCTKGFYVSDTTTYTEEITQYKNGDELVNLEPNTTYIMAVSYSTFLSGAVTEDVPELKADTFVQTYNDGETNYSVRTKYVFGLTEGRYDTGTIKFTTGSSAKIVLGFWLGNNAYKIILEGYAICKANTNEYYKQINEADIDEKGYYLTDNTDSGFIEKKEERALVLGDANGDYETDIRDLVRLKKYCEGNDIKISLKSCRLDEEKGAEIVIESEDVVRLTRILLKK